MIKSFLKEEAKKIIYATTKYKVRVTYFFGHGREEIDLPLRQAREEVRRIIATHNSDKNPLLVGTHKSIVTFQRRS